MIKVIGNDFFRGGVKIGFIGEGHIHNHSGEKVGYYTSDHVYNIHGHKSAFIQGYCIYFTDGKSKIRIEDNNKDVVGGSLSNVEKAAARVLLGE